jgi:transposase-like protein
MVAASPTRPQQTGRPTLREPSACQGFRASCRHRPVPYLNNVLEQDHRAIKRRVNASQGFRSFWAAWRTLAGYETDEIVDAITKVLETS